MKRAGIAALLGLWMPIALLAVAVARFGSLPRDEPVHLGLDLLLGYLAGLPAAACTVLAWPPAGRRARLRFPMEVAAAVVLGTGLATVGGLFGPWGVLAAGLLAALPLLGPAVAGTRRPGT